MAWIESHQSVAGHPKTRRAARQLGISIPTMVGHLHLLWHWALDYAQEGDLSKYDVLDIAEAAQWEGDPAQFIEALINAGPGDEPGFLERDGEFGLPDDPSIGCLVIRDWWDYAGKLIAKRQADAERKRQARNETSQDNSNDVPKTSAGRPLDVAGNRNRNLNQPTVNQPTKLGAPDKPARVRTVQNDLWDAFVTNLGTEPRTKSERGKWNGAIKELLDAEVQPNDIPGLIKAYRTTYPDIDCNPRALANNLSAVMGSNGTRGSPAYRKRSVDPEEFRRRVAELENQLAESQHEKDQ